MKNIKVIVIKGFFALYTYKSMNYGISYVHIPNHRFPYIITSVQCLAGTTQFKTWTQDYGHLVNDFISLQLTLKASMYYIRFLNSRNF